MLNILLTLLHIAVAVFLVAVVLLQTGKRADLAGAFGGGGSQTAFGTRGAATVLSKMTTAAAVLFMFTSIALSIVSSRGRESSDSVLDQIPAETTETTPAPDDGSSIPAFPSDPPATDPETDPESDPATDEPPTDDAN